MKPTKLQWEDVVQLEEVKGYGQHIWRDGNNLYYVTEEGGIAPQRVVYALPNEFFALLEVGKNGVRSIKVNFRPIVGHRRKKKRKLVRSNLY